MSEWRGLLIDIPNCERSEAIQAKTRRSRAGLLRRFASRNDGMGIINSPYSVKVF
ncbi:MAG: hypothetical protein LBK67_12415 [Coriobacteriales bacterium]|jgi:hypothetical protein|nr:hypothetical protein [Coriobacteriales bacterium]